MKTRILMQFRPRHWLGKEIKHGNQKIKLVKSN